MPDDEKLDLAFIAQAKYPGECGTQTCQGWWRKGEAMYWEKNTGKGDCGERLSKWS